MTGCVRSDGCDLYYEEAGDGVPILLIPPAGTTASTWAPVTEELARIGRVITYDRRGYARSGSEPVRNPADLAPTPGDITCVVAAVHTAADAVHRVAAEDREAVGTAAADHRLYVPAFTRTNAAVVRRRYRPACPSRLDEIVATYDDASEASTRATSKLAAEASLKQAHTRFDAADDQVAPAEDALHAAYADREAARRERFAARQAHERASAVVERLQRRVSELTDRLAKMP
jgi:pimeloyl-ACP methyl ester carboxylesterase